jgi:hypothetical protein
LLLGRNNSSVQYKEGDFGKSFPEAYSDFLGGTRLTWFSKKEVDNVPDSDTITGECLWDNDGAEVGHCTSINDLSAL